MEKYYFDQLEKHYKRYLVTLLTGESIFPLILRGGLKKPKGTPELHEKTEVLLKYCKTAGGKGWTVNWEPWNSRSLSGQN